MNCVERNMIEEKTDKIIKRVLVKHKVTYKDVGEILDDLKQRLLEETKGSPISFESPLS